MAFGADTVVFWANTVVFCGIYSVFGANTVVFVANRLAFRNNFACIVASWENCSLITSIDNMSRRCHELRG